MNAVWIPLTVIATLGSIGGGLNALLCGSSHVRPTFVEVGSERILRPGWLLSMVIGATSALALVFAMTESAGVLDRSPIRLLGAALACVMVGLAASRCLTDRSDKRLLRAAACHACAAPAAHPDTVRSLAIATPYEAYRTALLLRPRALTRQ